MATVFMRWLERRPATYDRGIRLLTLGRLERLYRIIAASVQADHQVLEIGCGTGALTSHLAEVTDRVVAIDVSEDMLTVARQKLDEKELLGHVQLTRMDAMALEAAYSPGTFDMIVSSLALSELSSTEQEYVLRICRQLLAADGTLLILDEVAPAHAYARLLFGLIRGPLRLATWLLTRTTTNPLKNLAVKLRRSGFADKLLAAALGGTLCVYQGKPEVAAGFESVHEQIPRIGHDPNIASRLKDAWALFFRVLPPYPKFEPGLYAIGKPDSDSPVLVTGNFDLTVRRVVRDIEGELDAWLLVVNSSGINVWCAAGGGFLSAERVIGALKMSGIDEWHRGKRMVLPQLCANGVDGNVIRAQTGWAVNWGPVRARDIPTYLENGYTKTEAMRTVDFPVLDRLEMVSATLGLYGLMVLGPVLIFWRHLFWPILLALLGLSYFYALALPLIPGRDGLIKSLPLAFIALAGMVVFTWLTGPMDPLQLFRRGVGMVALSVFVAAELQGMSPLMRGEQANWGWEALIAVMLSVTYWLLPRIMGWSA